MTKDEGFNPDRPTAPAEAQMGDNTAPAGQQEGSNTNNTKRPVNRDAHGWGGDNPGCG